MAQEVEVIQAITEREALHRLHMEKVEMLAQELGSLVL
jgi:hypothetical protein